MRINPVGHGNNNNLYCTTRKFGVKVKMVMFFDHGTAYVMSVKRSNPNIEVDWDAFYKELVDSVDMMDFELQTPRKGFIKLNMNSENFKHHLREKYSVNVI